MYKNRTATTHPYKAGIIGLAQNQNSLGEYRAYKTSIVVPVLGAAQCYMYNFCFVLGSWMGTKAGLRDSSAQSKKGNLMPTN